MQLIRREGARMGAEISAQLISECDVVKRSQKLAFIPCFNTSLLLFPILTQVPRGKKIMWGISAG